METPKPTVRANKKYTVFISSTYEDLKEERQEIVKACLKMGHIPIGMEMFSAGNETQWEVIRRTIDDSDYYVVIVATRYGTTMDGQPGISYTEREYDYAVSRGVPVIGLLLHKDAKWPESRREAVPASWPKLDAFKSKVQSRMVEYWSDAVTLRTAFVESFANTPLTHPRPGWVRATEAASPETANEIARLSTENAGLRVELLEARGESAAKARQDSVIDALKALRSVSLGGSKTMWHFFRQAGNAVMGSGTARSVAEDTRCKDLAAVSRDIKVLIAYELMEPASVQVRREFKDDFQGTGLGRQLVRRVLRERIAIDPARKLADA